MPHNVELSKVGFLKKKREVLFKTQQDLGNHSTHWPNPVTIKAKNR